MADYRTSNGFEYSVEDNEARILKYLGNEEEITIPAVIDGIPVTGIDSYIKNSGLCDSDTLKRVIISEGVKEITLCAFDNCQALERVTIPASVTEINAYAFSDCDSLENIIVDENNPKYADVDGILFSKDKKELLYFPHGKSQGEPSHYDIPDGVTAIGFSAFYECFLDSVTIPGSVAVIDGHAFDKCNYLKTLTIQDGVKAIKESAFEDCAALESINIPASVTEISVFAFKGCKALERIDVDENNQVYSDFCGILLSKDKSELIYVTNILNMTTPLLYNAKIITRINDFSYSGVKTMLNVWIHAGITEIGLRAFEGCQSLEGIMVDENNPVFSSVDGVLFNKDKTKIILFPPKKRGDFIVPDSVTEIGESSFLGCKTLKSITTLKQFNKSGEECDESSLKLILPDSVKVIDHRTFAFCGELKNVTLPDSVTTIGSEAFWECTFTDIELPSSVTKLSDDAFFVCEHLSEESWKKILKINPKSSIYGNNMLSIVFNVDKQGNPDSITINSRVPSITKKN